MVMIGSKACSKHAWNSLSHVQLFVTPWTIAHRAPLSMEFSRQEYWSGFHSSSKGSSQPRDWTQVSRTAGRFFTVWATNVGSVATNVQPYWGMLMLKRLCLCRGRKSIGQIWVPSALFYCDLKLLFLGSRITADGDCSHEIGRLLLLGRKLMANLDSILKSRDITLPTKSV